MRPASSEASSSCMLGIECEHARWRDQPRRLIAQSSICSCIPSVFWYKNHNFSSEKYRIYFPAGSRMRHNLSELVITCLNSHIQHYMYTNALTCSVMVVCPWASACTVHAQSACAQLVGMLGACENECECVRT